MSPTTLPPTELSTAFSPCSRPGEKLLQYHLVVFLERIVDQLRLSAVGNSNLDSNLAFALFALRIWHFHGRLLFLVVDQRTFRNLQNVLVFFQNHFGIRCHISLKLPAWVIDGGAYLKGGDVVLLDSHRRNLRHLAGKSLVL